MATWRGLNWQRSMYGPSATPEPQPPTAKASVDLPPPPPAIEQPAAQGSWERELSAPPVGPNPFARWQSGDISPWDPASFPDDSLAPPKVTPEQRATYAYNAGFRGRDLVTAVAISMAENQPGDPWAMGPYSENDNTGENEGKWHRALGLWQIRPLTDPDDPRWAASDGWRRFNELMDPQTNANAAMLEFKQKGFGGWEVYNRGLHEQFLSDALQAVAKAGFSQ